MGSWAVAHDYKDLFWVKANLAWTYYLAGRNEEALQAIKGGTRRRTMAGHDDLRSLGRFDEAKTTAAEWAKTGSHSVLAETCMPIREPMKQKYLDDLRKAGVPEQSGAREPVIAA